MTNRQSASAAAKSNRRNAWLYIGLGVLFLVTGGVGLLLSDSDLLDWLFIVLGVINVVMGVMNLRQADKKIDPFAPKG